MGLSRKRQLFVQEYLICWNASEAARRAGYSEKTAGAIGAENLKIPEIRAEIARRVAEKTMTADEVLVRLTEQARAEYSPYMTAYGTVDMQRLIEDGKAHLIKSISDTAYGKKVEFYDGQAALVHIAKHLGMFQERTEHTGEIVVRVKYGDDGTDGPPA